MSLYNNQEKQERECSKCHQIKHYSEFKNRSDFNYIKRSICKDCEIKMEAYRLQMMSWINKIHAIRFVTNDINKCQLCFDVGIENLPMFDFHHPKSKLTSRTGIEVGFWRSLRYKSWPYIKNELIKQEVIVVCRNCHAKCQSTILNEFKELIQKYNDPKLIALTLVPNQSIKLAIQRHIRKKMIILELWDGHCVKCDFGITNNKIENLSALDIHHINNQLKNDVFSYYLKKISDNNEIIKLIKKEKSTCLCRNCHIMVQSTFFNDNKELIFATYKKRYC